MSKFKIGDRVIHTDGFTGTVVLIHPPNSIFIECDPPFEAPNRAVHAKHFGLKNGYRAGINYLIHFPAITDDGAKEYDAIMAAAEAFQGMQK